MVESPAYFPPLNLHGCLEHPPFEKMYLYFLLKMVDFAISIFFWGKQSLLAGTYKKPWFPASTYPSHWDDLPDAPADENPRDTDMLRALLTASFSDRLLTSSRKHSEVGAGEGFFGKWLVVTVFQKVFGGSFEGFFQGVSCYKYITGWWFKHFFSPIWETNHLFFSIFFKWVVLTHQLEKDISPKKKLGGFFAPEYSF